MGRACGHKDCSTSSFEELITYGRGELDNLGFWSKPCFTCARAAEVRDGVPKNTYWPYEGQNEKGEFPE